MRPNWMTEDDYRILEYLVATDMAFTPKGLAYNHPDIGYYKAAARLRHLADHGVVERPEAITGVSNRGIYQASELGRRFIDGDITLSELRERLH